MARTTEEIQNSLIATINSIDASIDVTRGPIYDFLIRPFAPESSNLEEAVERLALLYSNVVAQVATDEEALAFATTFGLVQGGGTAAIGFVHFYRFARPIAGETITIPLGIVITNADNTLSYQTTQESQIVGDFADSYFNSVRNTYEVRVPIQALASGEAYNIPAYRINRLPTSLTKIDGVENRLAVAGGADEETTDSLITRTISKFKGINTGTPGGTESIVRNYDPSNVKDVSIVTSKNRSIFYREVLIPAMDVYIIGEHSFETNQIITATGGETSFAIENVPVLSVETVQVNGQDVNFTFHPDTELATKLSARSNDTILLETPVSPFDVININYTYNKLIADVQNDLFSDESRYFNTDILSRSAFGAYITFQANIKLVASVDPVSKLTEIENAVFAIIQRDEFVEEYIPNAIRDEIKSEVSGILEIYITKFTRTFESTTDIETITFKANEKPVLNNDTFDISVRQ